MELCFSKGQREKDNKKIMKNNRNYKGNRVRGNETRSNDLVKQKYTINSLETFSFVVYLIFMGPEDPISKYIISPWEATMNADTLLNILPLSRDVSIAMKFFSLPQGSFRVMWVVEFEDFTVQHA